MNEMNLVANNLNEILFECRFRDNVYISFNNDYNPLFEGNNSSNMKYNLLSVS